MLNYKKFSSYPIYVLLQNLQNDASTNLSILTHRPVFSTKYKNTLTVAIIEELHNREMQLTNEINKWPVPREEEGTPINEILGNNTSKMNLKNKLNTHNIYYIEQFMNHNCSKLLQWKQMFHNIGKIIRGRKPRWFLEIQQTIRGKYLHNMEGKTNPYTNKQIEDNGNNQSTWIITNRGLVGKVRKIKNNIATIRHWEYEGNRITSCCHGCSEHISSRSTPGVVEIHTRYLTKIIVNRVKQIYSDIGDVMEGFNKRKPKLQKILTLSFIPKRMRTSWKFTQQFTNIEEELWKRCKDEDERTTRLYQIKQHEENSEEGCTPTAIILNEQQLQ